MKPSLLIAIATWLLTLGCTTEPAVSPVGAGQPTGPINTNHAKAPALQALMDKYAKTGIPGVSMAVYSPGEGYWAGASGFARLEDNTRLQPGHLQYGQSVSKTYLAVAMLALAESGRIELDAPLPRHLSGIGRYVREADKITVRMLLNHQSGLYDYAVAPAYVAYLLQHPFQPLTPDHLLAYLRGKPLAFAPGSRHAYCNTNYLLLALIADQITGDHSLYLRQRVLQPAGLSQTFYHDHAAYLQRPDLVNSYLDRFGNGRLENVTRWQQTNVNNMFGDDGVVASPLDYVRFLRSVMEGRQLTPASLETMTTWVRNDEGKPAYGMGLFYGGHKGEPSYGHRGAGVGAGCSLYYFPNKGIYVFVGVNLGVITDGPAVRAAGELQEKILDEVLR